MIIPIIKSSTIRTQVAADIYKKKEREKLIQITPIEPYVEIRSYTNKGKPITVKSKGNHYDLYA